MTRYGMAIDIRKCNGCYNCFLACRDEFEDNDRLPLAAAQPRDGKPWMRLDEIERGETPKVRVDYLPLPCLQCKDAPCVKRANAGDIYQRPDGIVVIDPEKAKGRKDLVAACPHRLISWNEERNLPQKCTFCAHLIDAGWQQPRCVEVCPTGALVFGDLDDPDSEIAKLTAGGAFETFHPEFGLDTAVRHHGIPRRMVAGEVVLEDLPDVCARGVRVRLRGDGTDLSCTTDFLGDFLFDGLEANRTYTLSITHLGYAPETVGVKTLKNLNLGQIVLRPA